MNKSFPLNNADLYSTLNCRGHLINLRKPLLMGILNVTPDSFSDGGFFNTERVALAQAEKMVAEGAAIIDIGAQSTRPGANLIAENDEILRLQNIIPLLKKEFPHILLSLDTFYAATVHFGYEEGVDIINDISGGMFDEKMFKTVAATGLPYILMHVNPIYSQMHEKIISEDIIIQLNYYFSEKIQQARDAGIIDILLDPGFGFGKTLEQNMQLITDFDMIGFGKLPLLAGISRKSFIYKPLGKNAVNVDHETQILHLKLLQKGAKILRVHNVASAQKTLETFLIS